MQIQALTDNEIDIVSGGLSITDDWRVVPEWMWGQLYASLAYPTIPPKYRDSEPDVWVYD